MHINTIAMSIFALCLGLSSIANAVQPSPKTTRKNPSIIKSVASINQLPNVNINKEKKYISNQSPIEQLIQQAKQENKQPRTLAEARAETSIQKIQGDYLLGYNSAYSLLKQIFGS